MKIEIDLKKEIGNRLKEARLAAGYTQANIDKELQMSQQQYSRFENGVFELNYAQIVFLCEKYDISADYLFGLEIF